MKIYSMTATFGKLHHETLTLQPGLNIITAPNEWGKSTWCAFLVCMLYGIDTRARSTSTLLADKDRYAPWSGAPMSGRIDLNWNDKDITIERSTRGRLIFGEFRAYETQTGIDIPELTATTCGQMLLGVERNVFTQAGFLRLKELPVEQNDALRRRLNALVTTGDESGAGEKLGKQLKDLKNKCRFNRTGLLPQAESEQTQLLSQLEELQELGSQEQKIHARQQELEILIADLQNHQAHLEYNATLTDRQKVADAQERYKNAQQTLAQQEKDCQGLEAKEILESKLHDLKTLQEQLLALKLEAPAAAPEAVNVPACYENCTCQAIQEQAAADTEACITLEKRKKQQSILAPVAALVIAAVTAVLWGLQLLSGTALLIGGAIALTLMLFIGIGCVVLAGRRNKKILALYSRHPGVAADGWIQQAEELTAKLQQYEQALSQFRQISAAHTQKQQALEERIQSLTENSDASDAAARWEQNIRRWTALEDNRKDILQLESHASTLQSVVRTAPKPELPDLLTQTESETESALMAARFEQKQLQLKLGQSQGRAEGLGQEDAIRSRLKAVNRKISRLEDTYEALELAQKALSAATTELQRRFAPRISKRAQALFSRLTGGRYERITLEEDLSLSAATADEDVLRPSLWRSDGTVDQLYLALRLAVAQELTPDAPLVLDDALVRFDDKRLATALEVLREEGEHKQVILFTCQDRESKL